LSWTVVNISNKQIMIKDGMIFFMTRDFVYCEYGTMMLLRKSKQLKKGFWLS